MPNEPLPARLALVWLPARYPSVAGTVDAEPQTIAVGTLDEIAAAWDAYLAPVAAPMADRATIGKLRTDGVYFALHLIGAGTLRVVAAPTYSVSNEAGEVIARDVNDPHAWHAANGRTGDYVVETGEELGTCECSEEYGPCEEHGETLVVREGASTRTADESALCLIDDLVGLGAAELSPYGAVVVDQARAALDAAEGPCAWIDPDQYANLAEELYEVANQVECNASAVLVFHDDGYRIVRPSAGYWHAIGQD
jgi:hypothetical protein